MIPVVPASGNVRLVASNCRAHDLTCISYHTSTVLVSHIAIDSTTGAKPRCLLSQKTKQHDGAATRQVARLPRPAPLSSFAHPSA